MPTITAGELSILLKAQDDMSKVLQGVRGEMSETQKSGVNLGKVLGGALAGGAVLAVGATVLVGKALYDAGQAAAAEEVGIAKLGAAVKATGANWDTASDAIETYLTKQLARTALDDGEGREAISRLVTITGDYSKALDLMGLAQDLAAAKGIDLSSAAEVVGRVSAGNTGILSRYGIVLKEGATATEALAAMQKQFGGQAEAYGNTYAGAQQKMQIALGNLKETVGGLVLPTMTAFATKMAQIAADVLPKVMDIIEELRPDFESLAQKVGEFVSDVWPLLVAAFSTFWEVGEKVVGFIKDNLWAILAGLSAMILAVAVPAFIAWATAAYTAAGATIAAMAPVVAPILAIGAAVALLTTAWKRDWGGIRTTLTRFWEDTAKPILETIRGWLEDKITAAIETLKGAFETMGAVVSDVLSGDVGLAVDDFFEGFNIMAPELKAIVGDIVKWLAEKIPAAIETLSKFWEDTLLPSMEAVWKFMEDTLVDAFRDVAEWLQDELPPAIEDLAEFWEETLLPAIKAVWRFIDDTLIPIFKALSDWFTKDLPDAIKDTHDAFKERAAAIGKFFTDARDTIVGAAETVKGWFTKDLPGAADDMKEKISGAVKSVTDAFYNKFTETMDKLNPKWREDWEAIKGAVKEKLDAAKEKITETLGAIKGKIAEIIGDIKDAWETRWGEIKSAAGDAIESARQSIAGTMDAIKTKVGEIVGGIKQGWETKWGEIKTFLGNLGGPLLSALGSAFSPVITAVEGIVGSIKGFFTGIDWGGVGRAIIEGVGNGIRNAAGWLGEQAANAASAALNAVKAFLGIGSPSKVAAETIGIPFVEGIALGINQETPALLETVGGVMEDMVGVADSLTSLGEYKSQSGIGSIVDAFITDTREAGRRLVAFFNLWKEQTVANVEKAGVASSLLADMFGPVEDWIDGIVAIGQYQKAANIGQATADLVADARTAGKALVSYFKLWKDTTFANVERAGKAAGAMADLLGPAEDIADAVAAIAEYERAKNLAQTIADLIADARTVGKAMVAYFQLWTEETFANVDMATTAATAMAGLFEPAAAIVDSVKAIGEYEKAENILQSVTDLIADARAAGKALVTYFQLWTGDTFVNVGMATEAATAMAGLFEPATDLVDGITAIGEYQKGEDIVTVTSELIADARAAGRILVDYFRLWSDNTFGNVETATGAATAMGGMFDAIGEMADKLVAITEIETIQPDAMREKIGVLTQFADAFMAAITHVRNTVQEAVGQIQTLPAVYEGALGGAAGIVAGLGNFIQQLANVVGSQGATLINAWRNLAWQAVTAFSNGFSSANVQSVWANIIAGASATLNDGVFRQLGLRNALAYKSGWEAGMGIASPSKVAINWGKQIAAGLSQGMTSNVTNNYNLNVTTTQPAAGVVASFNMMGAMA